MRRHAAAAPPPRRFLVLRIALQDLRWDGLLTACVVASLAAAIAPLLILFALKSGVVDALRADLTSDPAFRAVLPTETRDYGPAFFERWGAREDVGFLSPSITRGASAVIAERGEARAILDMVPTGEGDPVFLTYDLRPPGENEIALSASAADELGGVRAGETVTLSTTRTSGGRRQSAEAELAVSTILPTRADELPRVYAPLSLATDIEAFREGFAAPARGWSGETPYVRPAFDGVFLSTPSRLSAVLRAELSTTTGFFLINDATSEDLAARIVLPEPPDGELLQLSVIDQGADSSSVDRVRDRLAGREHALFPYVDGLRLRLTRVDAGALADRERGIVLTDLTPPDEDAAQDVGARAGVFAPAGSGFAPGDRAVLQAPHMAGVIAVPVTVLEVHDRETIGLPLWLASLLRRGADRAIGYDPEADRLVVPRTGYRGFRLYARSIDDVASVAAGLEAEGVPVVAQVRAIERVRVLDRGLSTLFWLIALIAGVGAAVAVLANLYGAVERKRSQLGHLRLLGFSKRALALFPLYQGGAIAVAASATAFALAFIGSAIINWSVADTLGFAERAAALSGRAGLSASALAFLVSLAASFAASARAMAIDPAEAIRDE